MPRKSEWMQRVPDALTELERSSMPAVDRATLERLLHLHRRAAIRLMHRLGGFQAGKTFLIDRQRLIEKLEQLVTGGEFVAEHNRRHRLADELERFRRLAPARKVRINAPPDVRDRVLKDLPRGIHLKPGELRIEFFGAEDLLRNLFELSQAIANDFGSFQKAIESREFNVNAQSLAV